MSLPYVFDLDAQSSQGMSVAVRSSTSYAYRREGRDRERVLGSILGTETERVLGSILGTNGTMVFASADANANVC
jgi:hypothetical protein